MSSAGKPMKSPATALAQIRTVMTTDRKQGMSLLDGLLKSLQFDEEDNPPKPPTVNQVVTACRPLPRDRVAEIGIILTVKEAHEWVSSLPGTPAMTYDSFRQKFRKQGSYFKVFDKEAHREKSGTIVCTYAQILHVRGYNGNPLADWVEEVNREFGLRRGGPSG